MAASDHWREHARRWALFGSPLRPTPEEVAWVERALAQPIEAGSRATALVLGMTPELVGGAWPAGTRVVAVDRSPEMIGALWSGSDSAAPSHALCADWRALPVADGAIQRCAGDGSLNAMGDRASFEAVVAEVARVLVSGGRLVCRFYLRPGAPETLDAIAGDLGAGKIASLHVLKWRLAAALHPDGGDGVSLAAIWKAWREMAARAAPLAWSPDLVATIDAYRESGARYFFPTESELRAILSPHFVERARATFDYPLGDRCPTLALDRRLDPRRPPA